MFTDMVGYTALTQSNESQAMEVLERHNRLLRPFFPKFHGIEVKAIGDSFFVEFDSALEALDCAVEIQTYLHDYNAATSDDWKVKLRIGIHLGDVIHQANDVFGDAVNIASRVYPIANPEGVCVSEQVYDQVHNKSPLKLVRLETKGLKNVKFPMDMYKVLMPWEEKPDLSAPSPQTRVAILPFASFSTDPNDAFFADGMTEEIISTVSGISGLEVVSRTSVMGYKGTTKKVKEIGRELDVGSVLEGSFRKAGNKIRVTTQLIDALNDKHLWAQSYDRELSDIFAVQSDIAKQVAGALKVKILPREETRLNEAPTASAEAYTFYLKGRYFWNERTEESLEKAMGYFNRALEKDPHFALAYAGLADSYTIMLDKGLVRGKEFLELGRKNADKALQIDGSLAEAHLALGGILQRLYKWASAESEMRKAIELSPSLAQAHHWLGVNYSLLGEWGKATDELTKAIELDPMSKLLKGIAAYDMVIAGRLDEGMKLAEEGIAEHPDEPWFHQALSLACFRKSQNERAVEEAKKAYAVGTAGHPWNMAFLLYILRGAGKLTEANDIARSYLSKEGTRPWNLGHLAMVYLNNNDTDKAFELLNEAYERTDPGLAYLGWPPVFDSVLSDLRYLELLRKVKPL